MKVLDLFSGIGGFSLGLERAGMKTVAFCEKDKKCRKVLEKHWPSIFQFRDIKGLEYPRSFNEFTTGKVTIDLICGGFPCQDISVAGKQKGLKGKRSGLWKDFFRVIKEVKPRYVIVENVANLRSKGLNQIIKDLWSIGYDSEWYILPASSVGAPHLRERCWIIAYPDSTELWEQPGRSKGESWQKGAELREVSETPYSINPRLQRYIQKQISLLSIEEPKVTQFSDKLIPSFGEFRNWYGQSLRSCDGVSERLDKNRLKQLGNAVIPQVVEIIGRAIMEYEIDNG